MSSPYASDEITLVEEPGGLKSGAGPPTLMRRFASTCKRRKMSANTCNQ
jgi:hypothetical protein